MVRSSLAASVLTFALPTMALAAAPCDGRIDEVSHESIVVVERPPTDGRGVAIEACGRVDALPAAVWPVVVNCQYFSEFLPSVDQSRLLSRQGHVADCETEVDLPFPLRDIYTVTRNVEVALESGGWQRRWTLLRGSYSRNIGSWTLLPWPGDDGDTLVVYNVDIDPDSFVPNFILRRLQRSTAPRVFDAVRERVAYCAGRDDAACRADFPPRAD